MSAPLVVVAGLVTLVVGAELVVRGGSRLAARLGISPIVIGLTVVSVGTSTPELAVGIDAALRGDGSLAVGNVAGTNIVNLLLILGLSAALRPLALHLQTLRLDLPMMAVAALVLLAMVLDGDLSRPEGLVLVVGAVGYTAAVVRVARRESPAVLAEYAHEFEAPAVHGDAAGAPHRRRGGHLAADAAVLVVGIVVIVLGADWLVDGSVVLARRLGVSEAVIGLTIVAIGTSAPELVTTVVSTIRGERDIAVGNLIGSSVYNIALILGATAAVAPIAVAPELVRIDLPLMTLVTLVCIPVFITGRRVSRIEGVLFVAWYVAYLVAILALRT